MAEKNNARSGRINEEFKRELSHIIDQELKNPNVTGLISVTKVKVTTDLKYAKVYVSILNSKNIKETLAGLKKSSGFMRSLLAKRINLRNTPELIFEKILCQKSLKNKQCINYSQTNRRNDCKNEFIKTNRFK